MRLGYKRLKQKKGCCIICQNKLEGRRRTFCSDKCRDKYFEENIWSVFKKKVLKRDKYTCQECGIKLKFPKPLEQEKWLEVHHIFPICEGGEEFDMENCITLCVDCHKKKRARKEIRHTEKVKKQHKNLVEFA